MYSVSLYCRLVCLGIVLLFLDCVFNLMYQTGIPCIFRGFCVFIIFGVFIARISNVFYVWDQDSFIAKGG